MLVPALHNQHVFIKCDRYGIRSTDAHGEAPKCTMCKTKTCKASFLPQWDDNPVDYVRHILVKRWTKIKHCSSVKQSVISSMWIISTLMAIIATGHGVALAKGPQRLEICLGGCPWWAAIPMAWLIKSQSCQDAWVITGCQSLVFEKSSPWFC